MSLSEIPGSITWALDRTQNAWVANGRAPVLRSGTGGGGTGGGTTTPPSTAPRAGSVAVGAASYNPPADAKYVMAGGSGGSGTISDPYRTAQAAVTASPSGSTLVLRGGLYHEKLTVPSGKVLTIQNYPNEVVWFDGSSIYSTWTNNGNGTWTAPYSVTYSRTLGVDLTGYPGDASRMIVDQVFVNEVPLTPVADGTTPGLGQFSVNQSTHTLTIGTDPTGKTVRVADLKNFCISSGQITLRGVGVRRYSPDSITSGTAMLVIGGTGAGSVIENCVFQQSGLHGVSWLVPNVTWRSVTIQDVRMSGTENTTSDGYLLQQVLIRRVNRGKWQAEPITACIKSTRCDNVTLRDCIFQDASVGYGVWFDVSCTRFNVVNCRIDGTGPLGQMVHGIEAELSDGGKIAGVQQVAYIAGNKISGVSSAGVKLYDTGYVRVQNNDLTGCPIGVWLYQDSRINSGNTPANRDPAIVPWLCRGNEVLNNIFQPGSSSTKIQMMAYASAQNLRGGDMSSRIAGNRFHTTPDMVQEGKLGGASRVTYNSLAALAAADSSVVGPVASQLGTNYQGTDLPAPTFTDLLGARVAAWLYVAANSQLLGPNTSTLPIAIDA